MLAAVAALAGLVARYLPIDNHAALILAVASPFLAFAAPIAVLLLLLGRRWVMATLAVLIAAASVFVQLPRFIGPPPAAPESTDVRVLTANLGLGEADSRAVVDIARDTADLLVVQEMTAEAAAGLSAAGVDATFPHRAIDPQPRAGGIGIWSRYPITESAAVPGYSLPMLRARVRVPGVAADPAVLAVHLAAPFPFPIRGWREDISRFPDTLRDVARAAGPAAVIVAGDLNSTFEMLPFRQLLTDGYHDAAEQAGAGMTFSFPNRRIAVLAIDHVLVRNATPVFARTVGLPRSDHRGLVATVAVPRGS